ncbi:MAG: 1-acyl-sn-glycerol-3-phosphate acyltransferase [Clostridia bacterium]|nr:1-acyl-sn-glycerol-3-phosphate acyltransferase [Clostridia bacterium]
MNKFYRGIKRVFGGIFKVLYRVKFIGREKEVFDKPYIVCANHTSLMDVVMLVLAFKSQIRFMSKKEVFHTPILGWFAKSMGAFPVDRKNGDVAAIKKTISMLEDGEKVGIFPQGTRRPYENPRDTEVKDGIGMIASRAGVGFVPVYIKTKRGKLSLFRKTRVIVGDYISLEEINAEGTGKEKYAQITNYVFDKVCDLGENTDVKW